MDKDDMAFNKLTHEQKMQRVKNIDMDLQERKEKVDAIFGEGYAKNNPEVVAAIIIAQATEKAASINSK